jgi:nickel superoxide dismutase
MGFLKGRGAARRNPGNRSESKSCAPDRGGRKPNRRCKGRRRRIEMRVLLVTIASVLALSSLALAHCQVPCGIYDDQARLDALDEHITTIEKAMKMIVDLSDDAEPNHNQIVRWVEAKNDHADDIAQIVTWYFLQQRVKQADQADAAAYEAYILELTLLHGMLVQSMKAKQTVELVHVEELRTLLERFGKAYMSGK